MRLHRLPAFLLLLIGTLPAAANDGSSTVVGDAYAFTPNDQIELAKEDLKIYLGDSDSQVAVLFTFVNHGDATEVTMAFPDEGMGDEGRGLAIRDFESTVDGKSVRVDYRDLTGDPEQDVHEGAWVKTVAFEAGQTREVAVNYTVRNGGSIYGNSVVKYTLVTGATWRGPIADFTCTVDWTSLEIYSAPEIAWMDPQWQRQTPEVTWVATAPRVWVLHLTDFEPTANLHLESMGGFWHFTLDGNPVPVERGYHYGDYMRVIEEDGEVWMSLDKVGQLFGSVSEDPDDWPPTKPWDYYPFGIVGPRPSIVMPDKLVWPDSASITLDPPIRLMPLYEGAVDEEPMPMISLRALITYIGGTYTWNAELERVDLTLDPDMRVE